MMTIYRMGCSIWRQKQLACHDLEHADLRVLFMPCLAELQNYYIRPVNLRLQVQYNHKKDIQ